jgi:hypothetical protein
VATQGLHSHHGLEFSLAHLRKLPSWETIRLSAAPTEMRIGQILRADTEAYDTAQSTEYRVASHSREQLARSMLKYYHGSHSKNRETMIRWRGWAGDGFLSCAGRKSPGDCGAQGDKGKRVRLLCTTGTCRSCQRGPILVTDYPLARRAQFLPSSSGATEE